MNIYYLNYEARDYDNNKIHFTGKKVKMTKEQVKEIKRKLYNEQHADWVRDCIGEGY